jgi:predicted TIM-barrel fold metal-dependent hydrolase
MIIDINAYTGHWPSHPVVGALDRVRASLTDYGVERICVSPLDAAWCRNPHRYNDDLYAASGATNDVFPVPVLDPTIATWRDELERAKAQPRVRLVKLLPAYSGYDMDFASDLFASLAGAGLGVIVQTRLEDPRRQHPLAQVPDVPAAEIADAAERHSDLLVIIGGPRTGEIRALKDRLLDLPNLYADVSQSDGMDAVKVLVEDGLRDRLLFGSHAPLFIPYSALSRVVTDLSDVDAAAILGGNAERIVNW